MSRHYFLVNIAKIDVIARLKTSHEICLSINLDQDDIHGCLAKSNETHATDFRTCHYKLDITCCLGNPYEVIESMRKFLLFQELQTKRDREAAGDAA